MGQILAIDYGKARCGIANTDDSKTIAFGLITVESTELLSFLETYCKKQKVDCIVFGEPKSLSNEFSEIEKDIRNLIKQAEILLPNIPVDRENERFTSKIALQSLHEMGAKKKHKKDKKLVDKISATLILQSYLDKRTKTI